MYKIKEVRTLLKVISAVFYFTLVSYISAELRERRFEQIQTQSTPQYQEVKKQNLVVETKRTQDFPMRLKIPKINIDAAIEYVGISSNGSMGVPNNTTDVGWFRLGPRPGEKGSAVIGGHLNGENGEPGVFANLHKLKEGDKLYIEDDKGTSLAFVVRQSRTYNSGYADNVFNQNDSAHLNLITCDGVWDETKKDYNKRLVVFTDIAHT